MDETLARAWELKQAAIDFVLDAEGELAAALETYAADRARVQKGSIPQGLIVDAFLTEGKVGSQTPLEMFLSEHSELSAADRGLVAGWQQTFTGLFAVESVLPDGFELMNWLTDKRYAVKPANAKDAADWARLSPGEILLTRIAPVTDGVWMVSSPSMMLGKLGKPKLAVAIGSFRDNHKRSLYSDAPDLLEQAWQSVDKFHQAFLDFYGSDEVTMPGYQLNQKMGEFQQLLAKRQLAEAGIDDSKPLGEGMPVLDEAEVAQAAAEMGVDAAEVAQAIEAVGKSTKMMPAKVDLPDSIKKAEQVTVLAHPRWGQMFLPNHSQIKAVLTAEDWHSVDRAEKTVRSYLEDFSINRYVWQQLAAQYPQSLERVLQELLQRPNFRLSDLPDLMTEYGKAIEPELPEVASVPIHLHNLFEEAVVEVNKSKPKGKAKPKGKTGFGGR